MGGQRGDGRAGALSTDLQLAVTAAELAGAVASRWFRQGAAVSVKGTPGNVVTDADVAAEAAVRELLERERPADGILGEEGSSRPGTRRWLIDAVDGTLNFTRDDPFWCSAVALEGRAAAVHSRGSTWSAAAGQGCFLNGTRLQLGPGRALSSCVLASYLHPGDVLRPTFQRAFEAVATTRSRGSGSLELAWVASGRIDVWLQRDVYPWDWEPGALLVSEAGGSAEVVSREDGAWHVAGTSGAVAELVTLLT